MKTITPSTHRRLSDRYRLYLYRLRRLLSQSHLDQSTRRKMQHYLHCLKRYGRRLAIPGLTGMLMGMVNGEICGQGPVGTEFRVNSFTGGNQFEQAIAMDDLGNSVVAYTSKDLDGSGYGVYLKRYDQLGMEVQGETKVNSHTTGDQRTPAVAVDVNGDFVVVWQSQNQAGGTSGWDIYGQRYNAQGMELGAEFRINSFTTGNQVVPSAGMDEAGNFVAVWMSEDQEGVGSDFGIYAQRYSTAGTVAGSEFRINQFTTDNQQNPDVAMDADGDFVVVWQSRDQAGVSSGLDVYARRYNSAGTAQGNEFLVNTAFTTSTQSLPKMAVEKNGDFVIVWQSLNEDTSGTAVLSRRYQANGTPLGGAMIVNTYTTSAQAAPNIAMDADGDFAVVWQSYGQDGDKEGIYGQRYNRAGLPVGGEFQVHAFNTAGQTFPVVAMDGDGDFMVSWFSYNQEAFMSGYGVYAQRYCPGTGGEFRVNTFTSSAQSSASVAMDSDGNFVVLWQSYGQDGDSYGIYGQRYNATGITQGAEFRVNSQTSGRQSDPSVAMDSDGNFVVVWSSNGQDGSHDGIYGQRYNKTGVKQGEEFQVNTFTTNFQRLASVAMDSDGDFVVVWESIEQDGDHRGIYGQRYLATGITQGGEFLVNTHTTDSQGLPSVAIDSNGDFVVVWQSLGQDSENYSIYAQRYNATGITQGGEFLVNTHTTDAQREPAVAMDSTGDFVVVWKSSGQDGDFYGIYAQLYNATGITQGGEFLVNTHTTSNQALALVARDSDGDFVVVWTSFSQDGDSDGVYGQRYNAMGIAQGGEFRVNTRTPAYQTNPSVAMDNDGDFVVTWGSGGQDGSLSGIYSQRYRGKVLPCQGTNLSLTGNVNSLVQDHTQGTITSNQILQSTAQVVYQSGMSIFLEQDFQVQTGAVFQALIDDCGL